MLHKPIFYFYARFFGLGTVTRQELINNQAKYTIYEFGTNEQITVLVSRSNEITEGILNLLLTTVEKTFASLKNTLL